MTGATTPRILRAHVAGRSKQLVSLAAAALVALYAVSRLQGLTGANAGLALVYVAGLGMIVWDLVVSCGDRRKEPSAPEQRALDGLRVVALVPAYNEDESALRDCLASLVRQSRRLDAICVTDDGSTTGDYGSVRPWFEAACAERGITAHWIRQENGGKRRAQVAGVHRERTADVYLTVDSDTILDPEAVAQGLRPFADASVQSVAGVVLTANYRTNVLTRLQELWFTTMQLVGRGALSRMGAVQVNCGGLALYRAPVVLDNLDVYVSETCMGRPMHASDDSLLTLFALRRGRAVQQVTAFAFTLMPTTFSHYRRQQLRWLRGSTVRSAWRLRYLPTGRFAFWHHLARWAQYGAVTALFVALAVSGALFSGPLLLWSLAVVASVQLVLATPYLTLRRNDQSTLERLVVFATAPLLGVWQLTVMRVLRWYAMLTFPRVAAGWGTRGRVEVAALGS